jgi:hypothetical protein
MLVGDGVGNLLAVDLTIPLLSMKKIGFAEIVGYAIFFLLFCICTTFLFSGSTSAGAIGPVASITRINPICTSVALVYHGDTTKLLTAWDLGNSKADHVYSLREFSPVSAASWHRKGDRFLTGHENGLLCLWKYTRENKPQSTFPG